MDYKKILDEFANSDNPIALGGCRAEKINHECCDYNIVIFDPVSYTHLTLPTKA